MNELFKMNEYGDIWQEPTLFDQRPRNCGHGVSIHQPCARCDAGKPYLEELATAADDAFLDLDDDVWPEDEDDDYSYSEATGDYGQYD